MKKRNGHVSNSSSSSFLIVGELEWKPEFDGVVKLCELTDDQKWAIREEGYLTPLNEKVSLTNFISDATEAHFILYELTDGKHIIEYQDGNHGVPYDEEYYDKIAEDVWILKTHNESDADEEDDRECPCCGSKEVFTRHECLDCEHTWSPDK